MLLKLIYIVKLIEIGNPEISHTNCYDFFKQQFFIIFTSKYEENKFNFLKFDHHLYLHKAESAWQEAYALALT